MRNSLLLTTAATALIACTTFAVAQNAGTEEHPGAGATHSQSAPTHPGAPGGAMGHPQQGQQGMKPTPNGGSAQTQPPNGAPERQNSAQEQKNQERMGQEQKGRDQERMGDERSGQTGERNNAEQRGGQNGTAEKSNENGAGERAAQTNRSGGASVKLSEDQRTKIQHVIVGNKGVARVDHPNFSVTVGVAIPRSVHVVVLPEEIVQIVPEYRGYDYVLVGDQILIIEPDTLQIVAIIPA
jgi:TolA-binding protein